MRQLRLLTAAEQVAEHLLTLIKSSQFTAGLPGAISLSKKLGVNHKTMESALQILEKKQILINNGIRKRRTINNKSVTKIDNKCLRIAILPMEKSDENVNYIIELRNLLLDNGHQPFFTDKSLMNLGMDIKKVSRFVKRNKADAWIVNAASREILQWFASQNVATFALFGHYLDLPIAAIAPKKSTAIIKATNHLIKMGHQRISLLCRKHLRAPNPTPVVSAMLEELEKSGIKTSEFNLPDWEETKEGYNKILNSLFKITPPTAIITDEAFMYTATLQYLASRGLKVPEDVSIICTDNDPNFDWCSPEVSHIKWDARPVLRRIIRWANNISAGKNDIRQSVILADFVAGETTGPPNN